MSFFVSHCHALVWLCCPSIITAAYFGGFESHMYSTTSHRVASCYLRFSLPVNWVASCHFSCPMIIKQRGSTSSMASYCCSLECLYDAPGVQHFLPGVALGPFVYTTKITGVAPCHPRCLTATHWGGFVPSQMS